LTCLGLLGAQRSARLLELARELGVISRHLGQLAHEPRQLAPRLLRRPFHLGSSLLGDREARLERFDLRGTRGTVLSVCMQGAGRARVERLDLPAQLLVAGRGAVVSTCMQKAGRGAPAG